MYNSTHYPTGYQSAYPQYQQNYAASYGYQGYGSQYTTPNTQPAPPGESFPANAWNTSQTSSYGTTQNDAVAQEMQQQKAQLVKQREDYVKKVSVLRHELDQLRLQKQELVGDSSSDRDLANILKENDKLQEEIQGKMKAIHNVIEMLSSIIKDGRSVSDLEASLGNDITLNSPASQSKHQGSYEKMKDQSPDSKETVLEKYCYVHYDTGLHWCWLCDEFPETAKDFLLHLQDKKHREMVKENDVDNTPWHKLTPEPLLPSDESAPKKRIPIKGLQFFISAPSWYCKLCDLWIGDLHCASHHLKSKSHYQNYENFVKQNPHWEMEWLKDRERAKAKNGIQDSSDSDGNKKKRKRKEKRLNDVFSTKEKKRKKRSKKRKKPVSDSSSSSSSSDSSSDDDKQDRARSIRVAMRNMKQVQSIMDEDLSSKWNVLERLVEEHKKNEEKKEKEKIKETEDPLINQWMTVSQPPEKDKRLLEDLKDRMKQKQEQEKARQLEVERKKRERENEERELMERQEKAAKEAEEEIERQRKQKEQEDLERIRNRNQVKFKTNYRRRGSPSRSDEEEEDHHEKYKRDRYRTDKSYERESRSERTHEHERSYDRESTRLERSRESERSREHDRMSERSHERDSRPREHERPRERSRTRSRSPVERKSEDSSSKKKPPGPPSYKKLPFIGRMPLFKNKKMEEKEEKKEIQKESYETPRRTRFQPGNLARAFIPKPDVVCFPKLSSIPPLTIPPPPSVKEISIATPKPPKISVESPPKAPPPPKIAQIETKSKAMNLSDDEMLYAETGEGVNPDMMSQYYADYNNMMYQQSYEYQHQQSESSSVPHSHTMPLEPPPLPPDDDLALLGICADDMAAQTF